MSKVTELKPKVDRIAGITFTNADCNSRLLSEALEKLDNYTGFDGADLSRFNKIKNAFDVRCKDVKRMFKKLVDKHSEMEPITKKNETTGDLEPVLKPNGSPAMRPKIARTGPQSSDFVFKDRKAFNEDYKLLMEEPFHVEAYRLLTDDLRKAGLTPKEIRACAKILSDVDPELIQTAPIFEEEDEEEDDLDDDAPEAIPGSSVDQAAEAPNNDAEASAP